MRVGHISIARRYNYTVFSLAPVLIIVIAIAGFVFGAEAARGKLIDEISSLMGRQGGEAIQTMIASAGNQNRSGWAGAVGLMTLLVTASGVFSEIQAALNAIWRAKPRSGTISRLVRARIISLGLVMTLGFLLLVSLVVSTILSALVIAHLGRCDGGAGLVARRAGGV